MINSGLYNTDTMVSGNSSEKMVHTMFFAEQFNHLLLFFEANEIMFPEPKL